MLDFKIKSFDGRELYMVKNPIENQKAVVVFVHGLGEHLGRYEYLTKKFNEDGFSIYRFDHRGHGHSAGARAFYEDYNELIDDVNFVVELAKKENPQSPIYVLGHSMGGYAVSCYGVKYPERVDGIIMSGGLTRDKAGLISSLQKDLNPIMYLPNTLGSVVSRDPEIVKAYGEDPLVLKEISVGLYYALAKGLNWLKENTPAFKYPVLVLHGGDDRIVSCEDSIEFYDVITSADKKLKVYDVLFHEILNDPEKDEVISDILSWINARVPVTSC